MKNKLAIFLSLFLILVFTLSACGVENPSAEPGASDATQVSATAQTTEAPQNPAIAACPIGTWDLTDFTAYIFSLEENLSSMTNNEYTFKDNTFSGNSQFEFHDDQTAVFRGDNFTQSLTMSVNISETPLEIPIIIKINGTSTAKYTIEGDKINFLDQDSGDLVITIDVMGSATTMDQGMLGQPDTVQLYQFACSDANTLTLKVIAIEDMDLAPMTLTRAQ